MTIEQAYEQAGFDEFEDYSFKNLDKEKFVKLTKLLTEDQFKSELNRLDPREDRGIMLDMLEWSDNEDDILMPYIWIVNRLDGIEYKVLSLD